MQEIVNEAEKHFKDVVAVVVFSQDEKGNLMADPLIKGAETPEAFKEALTLMAELLLTGAKQVGELEELNPIKVEPTKENEGGKINPLSEN